MPLAPAACSLLKQPCILPSWCVRCWPLQKLYAEGGVPRLFRGFSPCLMRAVPANGVMLFTVDKMTQLLNPHH